MIGEAVRHHPATVFEPLADRLRVGVLEAFDRHELLTARGQIVDKVVGLKLGADDYVTKPFDMSELLARVEAHLRRAPSSPHPTEGYAFGDVRVDFRKAEATKEGAPLELSAREFQLLRYFLEHRGATLTRDELLNEVWGYNSMPSTRTVHAIPNSF